MGAEPWRNFTPYQPDINQALQDLQQQVFLRGEFDKPYADLSFLDDMEFFAATEEERAEMMAKYGLAIFRQPIADRGIGTLRQWLVGLNALPQVRTREELDVLASLSTDGTRSILDMHRIAANPASGCVSPFPASELARLYGTEHPTHEMVEQNSGFYEHIPRGYGIYFLVYEADNPREIFFAGYSYD